MRLLCTGDLHIERGSRLQDQQRVLQHIADTAAKLRVDVSIITGDLFGRAVPYRTNPEERTTAFHFASELAKTSRVIVLYGNHDAPGELDAFGYLPGVFVVDKPTVLQPEPGLQVYCCPYPTATRLMKDDDDTPPRDPKDRAAWMRLRLSDLMTRWGAQAEDRDAHHVFAGHLTVRGSEVSGGEVFSGSELAVGAADLEAMGMDFVVLGHIHRGQELAHGVAYMGSPYQVTFDEEPDKSFGVVDLGEPSNKLTRWPTHSRRLQTVRYRWGVADGQTEPGWLERPDEYEIAEDAEVKAILEVSSEWRASCPWDEEKASLMERGAVRIVEDIRVDVVQRVRAPAIAQAETLADKMVGYWGSLEEPPGEAEQAAALTELEDVRREIANA